MFPSSLSLFFSLSPRPIVKTRENKGEGYVEMENTQFCLCRRAGKLNCSWTNSNPGRRFIGCERYGEKGACGYFLWVDPPMCERSKVVIPGLLRSLARHEAVIKKEKKKVMCMWVALIVSWVLSIFAVVLVWLSK